MKHLLHKLSSLRLLMSLAVLLGLGSGAVWAQSDKSDVYTSNVTLSTTGGTSASTAKVSISSTSYDAIKAGTGSVKGAVMITVPAGTKYLHLHAAAWNGETVNISLAPNGNLNASYLDITADAGIKNSTPFTLSSPTKAPTDYYKVLTFKTALTSNTNITFTAGANSTSGKRFVIWGVNSEEEVVAPAYTITAQSNNNAYGTVSLNGSVITGTPNAGYRYATPAYTVTTGTATVEQNGNAFTVTPESDCTVQINFEALPTYTVTYGDGGSVTETNGGAGVTLATRSAIGDYEFAGWSETNVSSETTQAPTIIGTSETYYPTSNITLYPVYSKTEGGGGTQNVTASVTIGDYASTNGWSNSTQYETVTLDENVTATADGGGNTGKYYSSNNSWRLYANESGTLNISTSGTLTSVTITYTGNKLTYNDEEVTSGTAVSVSGNSAMFAVSGSSSNSQVTAISVDYTIAGGGTTYYWSAPVAAAVERPEIVVAENPFMFSTTATITCVTEDATIYYSFDEEDWTKYIGELNITSATTLYAKAVKDENESSVASVKITKNLAVPIVTIDATGITNTNVFDGTEAGSLAAAVTYNDAAIEGAEVTWSGNNNEVATIDPSTGAVTLVAAGTVTFTATYAGNSDYSEKTETYEMTVTNTDPNAPGTENNPYTVAQAIENTPASGTSANVYIKGIVSSFYGDDIMGDGSNYRYYISDDGTTNNQLLVFRGKGLNNVAFSSADDLQLGDVVTILGGLTTYKGDAEVAANNYIVSRVEKSASDLSKTSDIALDFKNADLSANVADHISSSSEGAYTYESADETIATVTEEGVVTGLKVGSTTITVNQAATLSYKAGTIEIPVTVADTRVDATTIPAINISSLTDDAEDGTISVVDPVKADEGVTFSFSSSNEDVLLIENDQYTVGEIGTTTVTVTATASNSDLYKDVTATFEVTVNAAVKSKNVIEIAFDTNSTVYDTKLEGLVSGSTGFDGVITAESSNTSVLTVAVDSEGNVTVTPVAVGTATITFSAAETAYFLPADDVQQVFTVTAPEGSTTAPANGFTKVTATEDITDGEYLIVYEDVDGSVAFDGRLGTLDATENTIDVTISGNVIAATDETKAATFTIDATAGTIQSASGYYIGQTSNANGLATSEETAYTNTISIEEDENVTIVSGGAYLRYNSASNQLRFRYYKSSSYTNQQAIQLYKLSNASETVTLNKDGYATYCSVNPMDFSATEGYTAWRISSIDMNGSTGTINCEKITDAIKGGQGVLLYNKNAGGVQTEATINFADGDTEFDDVENLLRGTTAPTFVEAGEVYGLVGDEFVPSNADGVMPAGKAYLKATSIPANVKAFIFVFNDDATGITETRKATREEVESIFNLGGQRMSKMQRGVNIVNGKKVLVK